jgi:hypothetical protein
MKNALLCLAVALAVVSCEKNENEPKSTYIPMEVGNYWVYQDFNIDADGNEVATDLYDSLIITKDTVINLVKYFKLEGIKHPFNHNQSRGWGYYRDSSGNLIDNESIKYFSDSEFEHSLYEKVQKYPNGDTVYAINYRMEQVDGFVNVPAGNFESLNYKGTLIKYSTTQNLTDPRMMNNYYVKNVGKIVETFMYLGDKVKTERRLVRYSVKN